MIRLIIYALLLLTAGEVPVALAVPGSIRILVRVVDGRTGKPLKSQHLLFFGGSSIKSAREHNKHYEVVTGRDGTATLSLAPETRWIQVWVDWHVLCAPKDAIFHVGDILNSGVNAPNSCGSATEKALPGSLAVFVRPAHFWEKMQH